MPIDVVLVVQVSVAEVQDVTLVQAKQHLPVVRPFVKIVQVFLEFICITLTVHFAKALGVDNLSSYKYVP